MITDNYIYLQASLCPTRSPFAPSKEQRVQRPRKAKMIASKELREDAKDMKTRKIPMI